MLTNPALILGPRYGYPGVLVTITGSAQEKGAGGGWAAVLPFVAGEVSTLSRDDIQ
jgi:hypothetical protein